MISYPSRHCTVELQALPSRIGQVRRIVSAQLRYWHMDALIDRALLGVTELLTNVHRHAQPDKMCTVEIELLLDRLKVSVRDHDPRLPVVGDAESLATCGRGLAMVAAVSESWGARPDGEQGKVVWFTLPTPSPTRKAPPRPPRRTDTEPSPRPPRRTDAEAPVHRFPEVEPVGGTEPVDARRPAPAPARSAVPG
ncbi:ATP-binding protein [Streptomyces sp. NPDC052773]|uniref:ATP-binding protein n=1 Tax=Streptomyces sp. NPDC052773 TaxID=3365693 RepID=UPI0037D62F60